MYLGIDPDLHDMALAVWDKGPVRAEVIHVPRRKGVVGQKAVLEMVEAMKEVAIFYDRDYDFDLVAVEAQTLQRTGLRQHKRPQDIVTLGNVAGAAVGMLIANRYDVLFPTPEEWKGQIPKAVMQARLYDELGWGYEMVGKGPKPDYARPLKIPTTFNNISAGQWKHVGDAILLARWAFQQS